jgi:hypothetical protein
MTRVAAALVMLLAVCVALFWWLLPPVPQSRAATLTPEPFDLPAPPNLSVQQMLSQLTDQPVWGKATSAAVAGSTDVPWRFVGAVGVRPGAASVSSPHAGFVLLSFDNKEPEARRVGDVLPGGAVITRIGSDTICIRIDGRERKLPLSSL